MPVNPDRILLVCAASIALVIGLLIFQPSSASQSGAFATPASAAIGMPDRPAVR